MGQRCWQPWKVLQWIVYFVLLGYFWTARLTIQNPIRGSVGFEGFVLLISIIQSPYGTTKIVGKCACCKYGRLFTFSFSIDLRANSYCHSSYQCCDN